ncbi:hypothetical protein [Azospirillum agricola]|uniref:hypothetical protein n=1 Tax=Azospirillum agricola TaxID=1720247 RepID=UPI000A0EED68|nr:hypothetical protein [Azospirillum agricola]SMH59403.1 hypothetical protein SAMN02982994_5042 [Azospirillum lipoferum]
MPATVDVFGATVLVLGLAALGLSVIFEASRLSASAARKTLVGRRIQAREHEALDLGKRLDGAEAEALARRTTLDGLLSERSRIQAATTALTLSKIEMVHEVGEPAPGAVLFQGNLRANSEGGESSAGRDTPRRVVFAREIWERSNIVHVWAETPEAAMAAVQRAFSARSGITAARMQRAAVPPRQTGGTDEKREDPARPALRMAAAAPRPRAA